MEGTEAKAKEGRGEGTVCCHGFYVDISRRNMQPLALESAIESAKTAKI